MQSSAPAAPTTGRGIDFGILVLSLSILVLQIGLTRLLSVVLWYHFAFVAISLAMLGLALGGVALYLLPRLFAATPRLLPWYCRAGGITMVAALAWVLWQTPMAAGGSMVTGDIVVLYLMLLLPFALAGLAVSAILAFHAPHIGRLYARDLLGAGIGCIIAVPLLDLGGAPTAILVGALLLLLGGPLFGTRASRPLDAVLLLGCLGLTGWHQATGLFEPTAMHGIPDEDKSTGALRDYAGWNSHSRIVVSRVSDWAKSINIDGHATTGIYRFDRQVTQQAVREQLNWMPIRSGSMPYVALGDNPSVLLIGPGGGLDLLNGIYYGARITAVELNSLIHSLMSDSWIGKWAGDVYHAPGVNVVHDEARSWIRRSDERFDLIQASMIDTWAATAGGAFALAENSLYTVEAFLDYRAHLTDRGMVHFARWNESPPRQSLRLLGLIVEAMRRSGDTEPARHVVVIDEPQLGADMTMASVMWSLRPFTAEALQRLRQSIDERSKIGPVKVLCWPGEAHDNELSRYLRSSDRDAVLRDYAYDVTPTTDDRPFFFNSMRFLDTVGLGGAAVANEEAVQVLGTVLLTVLVITLLAFVLPMLFTLRAAQLGSRLLMTRRLGYFCCLGVGFMLVEIPLLQRFSLYMGHPTWSLSTVLGALLLGAGCGGMRTSAIAEARLPSALQRALWTILAAITLTALLTPWLVETTMRWPFVARAAVTAAVLAPLGYPLGMALPLGVRALHRACEPLVPWAWGLNGAASVLASVLAVAIGMHAGFTIALAIGVGCYACALLLARRVTQT